MLAREVDPEGKRTIGKRATFASRQCNGICCSRSKAEARFSGVLTKVDTVHAGEVGTWVRVFKNISHPLIHKYYVSMGWTMDRHLASCAKEEANREILRLCKRLQDNPTQRSWPRD